MSDEEDISKGSDDDLSNADMEEEVEEEENQAQLRPSIPEKPLTKEHLASCLSLLCKTGDGLAHAFVKLDAQNRELTDISVLNTFTHLRYVKLSNNLLQSLAPLKNNKHLILLEAENNHITEVVFHDLQYIQSINLRNNRLTNCESLSHPQVTMLNLRENELTSLEDLVCARLENLQTLELRGNRIASLSGLCLKNLKYLYLADNKIRRLDGIEELVNVQFIHLRNNPVELLTGLSENNKHLERLNLRGTAVKNINEIKRLYKLPALQILTLMESPVSEEEVYRAEVLIHAPQLQRLDKEPVNDDEKQEAASIRQERLSENLLEINDSGILEADATEFEEEEAGMEEASRLSGSATGDELGEEEDESEPENDADA